MSRLIQAVTLGAFVLTAPGHAFAQSGAQRQQLMNACMTDYRRHCFGVMPGGGRIVACLGKNIADLAPACATVVNIGLQCVDDYKKYCANAAPQNDDLKHCMEANIAKLTPGCARTVSASATNAASAVPPK